ncbi:Coenzyme F420 hydrogenase/dehydrogenase, beta subunit C-terminal domain [uncultured Bacteroides sp.]|uniref:Coenzyme F420 hydrogenase/dehydrogenase, beta subunit C-terminal domain n=1 Tax=uncultured Bacteroides sp. TaxID=162156 RepID=UPI002608EFD8|nr:Coenzyme F420 hydrogenase/dehydrogenase, beta subunit C-terminal domain [uncultured Bacteroides sp.]
MIEEVVKSLNCTGCAACAEICNHQAIIMKPDDEGFYYPKINSIKCVECGLCTKVCPVINSESVKECKGSIYAAANRNLSIRLDSSSGGIFSLIAGYVLSKNGIVVGAAFIDHLLLVHKCIDKFEDLVQLRGSKYIQSNIQSVFRKVKEFVDNKRYIYFVGTSCQVAAIKLFIKRNREYLITSDIVCHGVPSQKMFDIFINEFEKRKGVRVINYKFRDKTINGWSCSSSSVEIKDKTFYYHKLPNAYFKAYITGSIYREACYKCKFTTENRVSDITLADYWGINKYHSEFHSDYGVSLVIVNTVKGKEILDAIKDDIQLIPSKFEYAEVINKCLYQSTPRPEIRDYIRQLILQQKYDLFIDYFLKKGIDVGYFKFLVKKQLRRFPHFYAFAFKLMHKLKIS